MAGSYQLSPVMWQLFTDKDSLEFLAGGYVVFSIDTQRTVGKEVFTINGSPGSYTYISYGALNLAGLWVVTLNAQGAFDFPLYLYPYDASGNPQNYFVQWYNSQGVLQDSLQDWPGIGGGGAANEAISINLVPNPQFLLHYEESATDITVQGQMNAAINDIALGGWSFQRANVITPPSTVLDTLTFLRQATPATNPTGNPRYWGNAQCIVPGTDSYKYPFVLTFDDVNKFANSGQEYTYAFNAYAESTPVTLTLLCIQYFGAGGSTTVTTTLATFPVTTADTQFAGSFVFPSTIGKTIDPNSDDDYVALVLSAPPTSTYNFFTTDFILTPGTLTTPIVINDQPDSVYSYQSNAGFLPPPNADGSSFGLPIVSTITGLGYDTQIVGSFRASIASTMFGYLPCTGSAYMDNYEANAYSSDGIPYSRLANFLWNSTYNNYLFGGGKHWLTGYIPTTSGGNVMTVTTNQNGSTTSASDGSGGNATGFTFSTQHGLTANVDGLYAGLNCFWLLSHFPGASANATVGNLTNDWNVTLFNQVSPASMDKVNTQIFTDTGTNTIQSGYWTFTTSTTSYYVWQNIDGGGTDPAPGGTGIEVQISSTYSAIDVAIANAQAINGDQFTFITTVAASAIPAGAYFNIYAGSSGTQKYQVYYTKAGVGTNPNPNTNFTVLVALAGTETAPQVALATQIAINKKFFGVPDLSGYSLRGYDAGANIDTDALTRWNRNNINPTRNIPGSYEFDTFLQHFHGYNEPNGTADYGTGAVPAVVGSLAINTLPIGHGETRGKNLAVNMFIHY